MLRAMSSGNATTGPVLVGLLTSAIVLAISTTGVAALFSRRS
jgi:hypothetical protein